MSFSLCNMETTFPWSISFISMPLMDRVSSTEPYSVNLRLPIKDITTFIRACLCSAAKKLFHGQSFMHSEENQARLTPFEKVFRGIVKKLVHFFAFPQWKVAQYEIFSFAKKLISTFHAFSTKKYAQTCPETQNMILPRFQRLESKVSLLRGLAHACEWSHEDWRWSLQMEYTKRMVYPSNVILSFHLSYINQFIKWCIPLPMEMNHGAVAWVNRKW